VMSQLDQQLHDLLGIARPSNFAIGRPSLAS
jgi:hypothetical protein